MSAAPGFSGSIVLAWYTLIANGGQQVTIERSLCERCKEVNDAKNVSNEHRGKKTARSAGAIATEVIFEDDEVRVWDQRVDAGETIARHRHAHDYVLITVAGTGPIEVTFHDGTGGPLGDHFTYRPVIGRPDAVPAGHVETAVNHGDAYRAILVELKRTGGGACADDTWED